MSMRGGYQIIDLRNKPLYSGNDGEHSENHITIPRIYYNLFNSNARMILLSGLSLDGKGYRDYEIIPYENEIDGKDGFQAILRKNWNTNKKIVTTYYLNIANDDDVFVTFSELKYEDVDQALDIDSEKAIANKIVTENINRLDAEDTTFLKLDGSREMTGSLVLPQLAKGERSITQNGGVFRVNNKGGAPVIFDGVDTPLSNNHATNKRYVDDKTKSLIIVSNAVSTESSPTHGGSATANRYGKVLDIFFSTSTLSSELSTLSYTFDSNVLSGLSVTNLFVFTYIKNQPPGGEDVKTYYSSITINGNDLTIYLGEGGSLGLESGHSYVGRVMLVV